MGVFSIPVSESGMPNGINKETKKPKITDNFNRELEDRFVKLLIAQMKNQDPTNPMDNSQLTSQLAQVSTLAGIEKLNTTVHEVSGKMGNDMAMNASKLIGRGVMVPGEKILVETLNGEARENESNEVDLTLDILDLSTPVKNDGTGIITTRFGFELERDADSIIVMIMNQGGNVVRGVDLGAVRAGVDTFAWDGKLDDGTVAPDGSYEFKVEATSKGQKMPAVALTYSVVYGVIQSKVDQSVLLDLGLAGTVNIDDVRQII